MASRKISVALAVSPRWAWMSPSRARNASSCWPVAETWLRGLERLLVLAFAEIGVGQIEFHIVGVGIGLQRGLEMLDGVVVQVIAREQNADSGLRAEVAAS